MYDDVAKLISVAETVDAYADKKARSITERTVFVEVVSVGYKEFYQAQAVGLKPELVLKIADYLDYNGEMFIEYGEKKYNVIRTYRKGTELEIVIGGLAE